MTNREKELSNPFSTGNGGGRFEANIHATFVTLMLSGGYAPCLPTWPIAEIKLQGAVAGYKTDDVIVFVENTNDGERRKLLGQVKSSIKITAKDKTFAEVITAAWSDFNNPEIFNRGKDVIALITGPINSTDSDGVVNLLEQARHTRDVEEFFTQISLAKFCSNNTRNKLEAFREQLKEANNGRYIDDRELYDFLKHFHLLGYDLAKKGSVVSSLIQSHISQFNKDIPDKIWYQIVNEVQDFNQYAGTITVDTLPQDLIEHFQEPEVTYIPKTFKETKDENLDEEELSLWNQHEYAHKLVIACLIGSWDEANSVDIQVVEEIAGEEYSDWVLGLRSLLQSDTCPLVYKNSVWKFKSRVSTWMEMKDLFFTDILERIKTIAVRTLSEDDPAFELPSEQRFAASLHGKVLAHSKHLREGLAETMAIVGSHPSALSNCHDGTAQTISILFVRELLEESSWLRWASLNNLLPIISEASPEEFLKAIETALVAAPSPLEQLFDLEGDGAFGSNYLTGMLWAIEAIAWEDEYLIRAAIVLAEIASKDPGGSWSNRPANSLTDIFLPWRPHTLAPPERRQLALRILSDEQPVIAWNLLKSLLPNQHSTTSGTYEPKFRRGIPEGYEISVSKKEYWEQSSYCATLIVEVAGYDINRLAQLAEKYEHLPTEAADLYRERLVSSEIILLSEEERLPLWNSLLKFIARHRRFPDADWSIAEEHLTQLDEVAVKLEPKDPRLLYIRLFSERDAYLYIAGADREKEQEYLFNIRKNAISQILDIGGLPTVLDFMSSVDNAAIVGNVLAGFDDVTFDSQLLPHLLSESDSKQWQFISAYSWNRLYARGWQWFDDIDKSDWANEQIAMLLCALPFEDSAWLRAARYLADNENLYWLKTNANFYDCKESPYSAMTKLLEYNRPDAVIDGLQREIFAGNPIDPNFAADSLLVLVKMESTSNRVDAYQITEVIKAIQENEATEPEKLFLVEWAYVSILDEYSGGSPKTLENRLASDPEFFMELIQMIYRGDGEEPEELSEERRNMASNAYKLLSAWSVIPGANTLGEFSPENYSSWLDVTEQLAKSSGHYDVAMIQIGKVLLHAPKDPGGHWLHLTVADSLNKRDREKLRSGYYTGIRNSRGAHFVDPEAKPELELAGKYDEKSEEIEKLGFYRLAITLRDVANSYREDAERIINNDGY